MNLSLIVAADRHGLIGAGGHLPWCRLPADMARFRALTTGRVCLVGRRTYETLPPLPGRTLVVLSRSGASGYGLDGALDLARALRLAPIVIGGAEVYALALPRAARLYLTRIEAEFAGDTYWPGPLPPPGWAEAERVRVPADARNAHALTFTTWERGAP